MANKNKQSLTVSKDTFFEMLTKLIASGVTFEAEEVDEVIQINFTGGY